MFVPRSIIRGCSTSSSIPPPPQSPSSQAPLQEEPVKSHSNQQRDPEPDEPVCVICGRYGEYICDETDEDVCSLECKSLALERAKVNYTEGNLKSPPQKVACLQDECLYVKDETEPLPVWEAANPLSEKQADDLRHELDVHVKGEPVPAPVMEFANCNFPEKLQSNLELAGYAIPTPVQMQVIPAALKGCNILVRADTGSGKTAAFLLPIIAKCSVVRSCFIKERTKPLAIVMTPTRELCAQIEEQAKVFGKGLPFKTGLVVGGDAMPQQVYRIKQGVELVVGTPGRLVDLLARNPVDLDDVFVLVLDEVDCILERGFRDHVMQVIQALSQPQIMMFSATVPSNIEKFASSLLKVPLIISFGKQTLPSAAVKQTIIWVESNCKKQKLFDILWSSAHFHPPVVVFVNSRVGADLLAEAIQHVTKLKAAALHGEKPMSERRQVLRSFLLGELPIVVATGVLGRGLDLIKVKQVIVFDMPSSIEEYIHQIGRASRLGLPGTAMVFVNNDSKAIFKPLVDLLQLSGTNVPRELANSPYLHSSYAAAYNHKRRKY
ncbi:hypothetical protein GOP47_0020877 [Adiantum capillus-veneris]|uniref:RNA helicase n=1 Tax=Adiantum capillus-veneris TaxID=13818 RepID=A0A9D4Z854_ADICA|nr:hypothetical protein GOP47_0020877 [Adiantum capillus-veneris]